MNSKKSNKNGEDMLRTISLGASQQFEALEQDIRRGAMTISQLLAQKGIKAGVTLNEGFDTKASGLLSSNRGKKYKVGEIIAKGGMGIILDAKDLNCRRNVAMKVLGEEFRNSVDQIFRFIVEAQICAQLEHPSIVPVYELSVDINGSVFYTMKLVRGVTLVDVLIEIKQGNEEYIEKYPLIRLLNIFLRVCDAVAFAHSKNVVHRDLKPENIMIADYGEVLVMDWGLAKILDPDRSTNESRTDGASDDEWNSTSFDDSIDSILSDCAVSDSMKTMYGQVMGTPGFMPPEQALGKVEDIDIRSDVYALGGILYNILALQPPITGLSIKQLIRQIVRGDIEPPSSLNRGDDFFHCPGNKVPEPLSAIAMKALSANPSDRYQHVEELQNDVEKYLGGFATSVEDAGFIKLLLLLIKRNKAKVIAGVVALVVLIGLTTGFMIKIIEAKEIAEENLHKFLHEHNTRKEISRKLLTNAIIAIKENNVDQKVLFHRYSLLDDDFSLNLQGNSQLLDIRPLEELPLTHLDVSDTLVNDLHALKGMPLKWLNISGSKVKDLSALAGLPLVYLDISKTAVKDLTPISEMQLHTLNLSESDISDLYELVGMPLKTLTIDGSQVKNTDVLANLSLHHIGVRKCTSDTLKMLKDIDVTSWEIHGKNLKSLRELRDMDLSSLTIVDTRVRNVNVLRGKQLTSLKLIGGLINDISAVSNLPLQELYLERCYYLQDITPISKCIKLEKLLIPAHVSRVDFINELKHLKVLANNVDDYDSGQSVDEFLEKHKNEQESAK